MHSSDLTFTDKNLKQKTLAAAASDYEKSHRQDIAQRAAEMRAVVTDYSLAKTQRAREAAEEKRRDLHMLQNYDPWGKPGGGAPTV